MATRRALLVMLSGAVFAGTARAQQTVLLQERKETKMKITPAFSSPSKGPAEYFTGSVQIHSRYQGDAPARIGGAFVTFEPPHRMAHTSAWADFDCHIGQGLDSNPGRLKARNQ